MPSTVIRRFYHDTGANRLIIEFQSGRRYAYFDVPPEVYEAMRSAHSRGSYFNEQIRDRYSFAWLDNRANPDQMKGG